MSFPQLYFVVVPARAAYSPLRLGGQAVGVSGLLGEPLHVQLGVVPANVDHRSIAASPSFIIRVVAPAATAQNAGIPLREYYFVLRHGKRLP